MYHMQYTECFPVKFNSFLLVILEHFDSKHLDSKQLFDIP